MLEDSLLNMIWGLANALPFLLLIVKGFPDVSGYDERITSKDNPKILQIAPGSTQKNNKVRIVK